MNTKKCPLCGCDDYDEWEESEYEHTNDPTPLYGGKLINVKMSECRNCSGGE